MYQKIKEKNLEPPPGSFAWIYQSLLRRAWMACSRSRARATEAAARRTRNEATEPFSLAFPDTITMVDIAYTVAGRQDRSRSALSLSQLIPKGAKNPMSSSAKGRYTGSTSHAVHTTWGPELRSRNASFNNLVHN